MKLSFPHISFRSLRVFNACLLSFLMLTAPMAPTVASSIDHTVTNSNRSTKTRKPLTPQERLESALFVNPPTQQPLVINAPNVNATMSDQFVDNNSSGKADPGSVVTYTANVSNTGNADATGVMFNDTADPNTTQVNGSVKVSPLAFTVWTIVSAKEIRLWFAGAQAVASKLLSHLLCSVSHRTAW